MTPIFVYEALNAKTVYAIPYVPSQRRVVADLGNLQSSLAAKNLPKTLQNINCLWQQPLKTECHDRDDGNGTCFVRVEDKYQYVKVLQDDVRLPPLIFRTHDYDEAVAYRECIYREVTKGPQAYWESPKFPIQIPYLRNIIRDSGQALEQGICACNLEKLRDTVDEIKSNIAESGHYGLRTDLVHLVAGVFMDEIQARVAYIEGFLACNDEWLSERKPTSSDFYPWLGPNVEFDCWLFEQGIVRQWEANADKSNNKDYKPERDIFVRMYGLGRKDLEFLQKNDVADEREEQIATIERFHSLQAVLGRRPTSDIRGQFPFCSYAIRNFRDSYAESSSARPSFKQRGVGRQPVYPRPREKSRQELAEDRRREFKIAKVLVDRVWSDVEFKTIRALGKQIRDPRNGDWNKLTRHQQRELLGNDPELIERFIFKTKRPYTL